MLLELIFIQEDGVSGIKYRELDRCIDGITISKPKLTVADCEPTTGKFLSVSLLHKPNTKGSEEGFIRNLVKIDITHRDQGNIFIDSYITNQEAYLLGEYGKILKRIN